MSLVVNHNLMATNVTRNLSSHYGQLSTSTERLASGLRVNSADDDAAGLAIRELMRVDITAFNQGIRNANDAISMIQTADGALQIIDELLIRMKELAEQAATGTYDSTQRLMIDSEFQSLASEINRISSATDFNGIKLLDGSLSGSHNGSSLNATGAMKIHFGTANDSAEDYYYITIGAANTFSLGLEDIPPDGTLPDPPDPPEPPLPAGVELLSDKLTNGVTANFTSGIVTFAVIPKGTKNLKLHMNDDGINDSVQIFTRSGTHLIGTSHTGADWVSAGVNNISDVNSKVITDSNGFLTSATYSNANLNDSQALTFTDTDPYNEFTLHGMSMGYSGEGNEAAYGWNENEYFTVEEVTESLVVIVIGDGLFSMTAEWDYMPSSLDGGGGTPDPPDPPDPPVEAKESVVMRIATQSQAQASLERLDSAIVKKDNIRAHLGAMQNRLEATIDNLAIQAENLQASESRISDVDVGVEMTNFVRNQILTQSALAMLGQANNLPKMAQQLISG